MCSEKEASYEKEGDKKPYNNAYKACSSIQTKIESCSDSKNEKTNY
jgi:hypothetical protein